MHQFWVGLWLAYIIGLQIPLIYTPWYMYTCNLDNDSRKLTYDTKDTNLIHCDSNDLTTSYGDTT